MANKILIVDDEVEICKLMKSFLEKKGFNVHTVLSGEDALKVLDKEDIDLLILDKKMPGIGGLGVFWEVKKRGLDIPSIIMTGSRRMPGYEDEKEKMGYACLLFKPVDLDILLENINRILGRKQ